MSTVKGYDDMTNGQTKAVISKMGGVEVAMAFLRNEYVLTRVATAVTSALLTLIGTVSLPATTEPFEAAKRFVVNTSADAEVKISGIGSNFVNWFLTDGGKVEPAQEERELRYAKFKKASRDELIIADLGGETHAETSLTDLWSLLKKQAHGGKGALLTNGYANILYVRDRAGVLRTVCVRWDDVGWSVRAYPVGHPYAWPAGNRVLSRN